MPGAVARTAQSREREAPEPGTGVCRRARPLARMGPRPAWVLGSPRRLWSRTKVQGRGLRPGAPVDAVAWVSRAARAAAPGAPGGEDAGLQGDSGARHMAAVAVRGGRGRSSARTPAGRLS